jgi:hypothetical protein
MFMVSKNALITLAVVAAIVILVSIIVPISFNNRAADAEVLVVQAKDRCVVTYDNGIKSVIEMAQVDEHTKEYLKGLVDNDQLPAGTQQAYSQFVNGNPAQLMLLLGGVSGTDFTATATNVQREIASQRSNMLTCANMLISTQAELKGILGMDASGRVVKWPQTWLGLDYPSIQSDPTLRDNDGDLRLTVLDYRPPVDVNISESFGTGEGLPPTNIYGE